MEKFLFVIKDSNGNFGGHIGLSQKSICKSDGFEWDYTSRFYPTWMHGFKENAELELSKMEEINLLAGFDLTWEIVELTREEVFNLRKIHSQKLGLTELQTDHHNFLIDCKDIKKGTVTKTRKTVNDICKKYKAMEKRKIA